MFENFCSDIMETMKCLALESFNLSCQAELTKINSRLNFNPGLALITFWTTRPSTLINSPEDAVEAEYFPLRTKSEFSLPKQLF